MLISAYEQMSKSMRGLIEQNLEAASVGNRTQEDDDAILVRQGQIQEMQNALHTMETIFGSSVLSGRADSNI
jgi:flagellar biosynthesis/type III secretory pathway M-ring protein FliF/YscJ